MTGTLITTLVLWATLAWRAPGAWRKAQQRRLWMALATVTLALTTSLPAIRNAFRALPGPGEPSMLVRHVLSIASCVAITNFLDHASSVERPSRLRRHVLLALIVSAALTALYLSADRAPIGDCSFLRYCGEPPSTLVYCLIWLGYLGAYLANVVVTMLRWIPHCATAAMRRASACTAAGITAGLLFAAQRIAAVIYLYTAHRDLPHPAVQAAVLHIFLVSCLLLVAVAVALPNLRRAADLLGVYVSLLRLRRLWRILTAAVPNVVLRPEDRHRRLPPGPSQARQLLYRQIMEIRDALLDLSDRVPVEQRAQARKYASRLGLNDSRTAATAQACWLAISLREVLNVHSPDAADPEAAAVEPAELLAPTDLSAEVAELTALASAYFSAATRSYVKDAFSGAAREPA